MTTLTDLDKMTPRELREFAYVTLLLMQYANLRARMIEDRDYPASVQKLKSEMEQIRLKLPKDKW